MKTPEQIIKEYTRYIKTIAMRYNQPQYYDDMVSVGHMAAIQAYNRLDHSKINNDEKSYITTCIKGSIMNWLTNNARTIRIPRSIIENKDDDKRITSIPTISLDAPINDELDPMSDLIPSSDIYIYPDQNNELKSLYLALSQLKPEYQQIIELYFDLFDKGEPMTLEQIAIVKGQTKQNIAYKLDNAIKKLQKIMGADIQKIRNKNK